MNSRQAIGRDLFKKIHGGLAAEEALKNFERLSPEFSRIMLEWVYGDLYADNSVIDMRTREISNISALVAIGAMPQLRNHIHAAIKLGFSTKEIEHIVINNLVTVGFPYVINALILLHEITEEINTP